MIFILLCLTYFTQWWFLSPSMMLSMTLNHSFLCLSNIELYIHTPSSYSFLCWYTFGNFQVQAMVNSAAVNIWIHVSFWIMIFFGYMTRSGISELYVQFSSVTQSCPTLCIPMNHSTPGLPVHHQLLESTQTHVHWVSDAIQLTHPLLSPSPAFNLSQLRVFSNEPALRIRWPKYWSFSFNIRPTNEHPRLISFRMDWLDLLAVQRTLKSLLQYHSSKASVLQCSAFFIVQLSHPYMTTGKTIALTTWTFVGKAMSLLFNMLSRLVITFLPRSKHLLIFWLQSPSAVILEPRKVKSDTVSTVSPSICHEVMGLDAMISVFWMLRKKQLFHSPLSLLSRGFLVTLHFLP